MTFNIRCRRVSIAAGLSCALFSGFLLEPQAAQALTFNFTPQSGTSLQALNGFKDAGNIWSSFLTDNVTINITIGFTSLGANILADTESTSSVFSYRDVRSALISDATSLLDITATSNLQQGDALQFVTNTPSGAVVLDNDSNARDANSNNNRFLDVTSANAKALGLLAANTTQDAMIRFSSNFTFDFDRSDGISGSSFDFVGLAVHEIGHSLGFISGVDSVDYYSGPTTGFDINGQRVAAQDLNTFAVFNTLDLFRYSSAANTQIAGFGPVQDLAQGDQSYFSVDKGATNGGNFSTGPYDGDGRQASHWKDNQSLGVMDPTAAPGEMLMITGNDRNAFDAIGWNLAPVELPEPSALSLIGGALLVTGSIRVLRRRKRAS